MATITQNIETLLFHPSRGSKIPKLQLKRFPSKTSNEMNFPHQLISIIFHYWFIQKGKNWVIYRSNMAAVSLRTGSAYLRRHIGLRKLFQTRKQHPVFDKWNKLGWRFKASHGLDIGSKFNAFQLSPVSFRNKWRARALYTPRPPAKLFGNDLSLSRPN